MQWLKHKVRQKLLQFITANLLTQPPSAISDLVISVIVGSVLVLMIVVIAMLILIKKKKICKDKPRQEEERSDINPVYGTYEVHSDPVAEVKRQDCKLICCILSR